MRRVLWLMIVLAAGVFARATDIAGRVRDGEKHEPMAGVSVIVRDAGGKMAAFATTGADGRFALTFPPDRGKTLEAMFFGYQKQLFATDTIAGALEIVMLEAPVELREVTVKGEAIRQQGDTITYRVGSFAQEQDRSIGDVLRRMPGIDVAKSGKIKYQGEDINKFYIEGSDMLGGKYGVATNGINQDDVGAVEVMENHQPLQVLQGISFSDRAAINLKLKEKAKMTLSGHGTAGGGLMQPQTDGSDVTGLWEGEVFGMTILPGRQTMATLRSNNTGDDLEGITFDFINQDGPTLSPYVSVALPEPPNLSPSHTTFNRSATVSVNNLWTLKGGELKTNVDYRYNRVSSEAEEATTYYLEGDSTQVVAANPQGRQRNNSLTFKAEYEMNHKRAYIDNVMKAAMGWSDTRLAVTGNLASRQHLRQPDYCVSNLFKAIKRFGEKHLLTLVSHNQWESLPQTLRVENYEGGEGNDEMETLEGMEALEAVQRVRDAAFGTRESAAYSLVLNKVTLSVEGGLRGYFRSMSTELDYPDPLLASPLTSLKTGYFSLEGSAKMEYRLRRVNFILSLPLTYSYYHFDRLISNRSEGYFSPTLRLDWKPNKRFTGTATFGADRSPMALHNVHSGLIMEDYRTFRRGVDDFYATTSQRVSARVAYKHARRGLFADAAFSYNWMNTPFTLQQELLGQYVVYGYDAVTTDGQRALSAEVSLGKTLEFIHGSATLSGSYDRSSRRVFSQGQLLTSTSTGRSVGLKVAGRLTGWLNIDVSGAYSDTRLTLGEMAHTPWLSTLSSRLKAVVLPVKRVQWQIAAEILRTEPAQAVYQTTVLTDTQLSYQLSKKLELKFELCNLFNKRLYRYSTFSELSSYEATRRLRPREFLLSITINK